MGPDRTYLTCRLRSLRWASTRRRHLLRFHRGWRDCRHPCDRCHRRAYRFCHAVFGWSPGDADCRNNDALRARFVHDWYGRRVPAAIRSPTPAGSYRVMNYRLFRVPDRVAPGRDSTFFDPRGRRNGMLPGARKGMHHRPTADRSGHVCGCGNRLDQATESHQPEVEHRRCPILTPRRKRFAKGPE